MDTQRTDARVVVMCLDVDHFKHVNDSLGHPAGDKLLRRIGERLVENLSEIGTVARLGGDEFGVVLANIGEVEEATQVAWRLLDLLSDPVDFNGQLMASGVSIGIAVSGTDGNDPEELLKNADLALYRAKADGRGTFRCFEKEMDARAQARRSLEIDLREAITTQQLELHYQPQIYLDTNEIVGFEALLRWCHPTRGSIPPSEFIPIAEETGLIVRLGEWVLRRACSDAKGWPNAVRVAVNVSAVQFRNHDLAQLVTQVLCDTGLPARRLELEITELVLLRVNPPNPIDIII